MKQKLIALALLVVLFTLTQAQTTSMIVATNLQRSNLDAQQGDIYDRIMSSNDVVNPLIVRLNNLATTQLNGKISIKIPRANCANAIFTGLDVRYTSESDYYWYGEIISQDSNSCSEGSLTLMAVNGEKFGMVKVDTIAYELHDLSKGLNLIVQQVSEEFNYEDSEPDTGVVDVVNSNPGCLGSCYTRVLVLYTPRAAAVAGNIANIAQLGVSQTSRAFLNSAISLNVAHPVYVATLPFNFQETQAPRIDVRNLAINPAAQALRNQYQADIVVLLTNGAYFGIGGVVAQVGPSSQNAYAIDQVRRALKNYAFAHEVAHLFGARHQNDPVAQYEKAYQFNLGFLGIKERRTIMWTVSTNKNIQYYSNPNVKYKNKPTGNSTHDNARKIRETGCIVGNFIPNPTPPFSAEIQGFMFSTHVRQRHLPSVRMPIAELHHIPMNGGLVLMASIGDRFKEQISISM